MKENEIKIGIQTWTSKILDVETYRNGFVIPQVEDQEEWENLSTGAWCYNENKTANGIKYGKLYNWYAVNDPRGLAPKRYHIPTDNEWTILTDYLGGEDGAGAEMKSTTGWDDDDLDTNSSGFSALPGGYRLYYGGFSANYDDGAWWSSSESDTSNAWYRKVSDGYCSIFKDERGKTHGFSVRCLRD